MKKTAILVDEMSIMHQLHKIGVQGINPWTTFYETVAEFWTDQEDVTYLFFGNNIPIEVDAQRYGKRKRFFDALNQNGILVQQGFTVLDSRKQLVSKGIDVLMSMHMMELSTAGYDEIIVATASSNIVPVIERVKATGTHVRAIVSESAPAGKLVSAVDSILSLEEVLSYLPTKNIKWKKESVVA